MHLTGEVGGRPPRRRTHRRHAYRLQHDRRRARCLHERGQTGVGRHVEVSLMDAGLAALLNHQPAC